MEQATNDREFIEQNIDTFGKEFDFWLARRIDVNASDGKTYKLARYNVEVDAPRPGTTVRQYDNIISALHKCAFMYKL